MGTTLLGLRPLLTSALPFLHLQWLNLLLLPLLLKRPLLPLLRQRSQLTSLRTSRKPSVCSTELAIVRWPTARWPTSCEPWDRTPPTEGVRTSNSVSKTNQRESKKRTMSMSPLKKNTFALLFFFCPCHPYLLFSAHPPSGRYLLSYFFLPPPPS